MSERIVIVGGGQAAGVAAASLRENGYGAEVVLVADEPYAPYQRPPLSKSFLAGEMRAEQLQLKPAKFYEERAISLRLRTRVASIDRGAKRAVLEDGTRIEYSKLLLATGSRPRRLTLPGVTLAGVHYLRTLDDVEAIRRDLAAGKCLAVIGGGYIGLEAAAVGVKAGMAVTVLEAGPRILNRVSGPPTAEFVAEAHRSQGADIRCNACVEAIEGAERVRAVATSEGRVPADLVIIGVGIEPITELASAAGLACDNGIVVDEYTRTADPDIHAAGDCTNHPNARLGRRLRLESVQNAVDQARVAAANLCGKPQAYAELPWFWSNQYDLRLQIAGLSQGYDEVFLRGEPASRSFSVLYVCEGRLVAADTINAPRDHLALRKLIASAAAVEPKRLSDPAVPIA